MEINKIHCKLLVTSWRTAFARESPKWISHVSRSQSCHFHMLSITALVPPHSISKLTSATHGSLGRFWNQRRCPCLRGPSLSVGRSPSSQWYEWKAFVFNNVAGLIFTWPLWKPACCTVELTHLPPFSVPASPCSSSSWLKNQCQNSEVLIWAVKTQCWNELAPNSYLCVFVVVAAIFLSYFTVWLQWLTSFIVKNSYEMSGKMQVWKSCRNCVFCVVFLGLAPVLQPVSDVCVFV